MRGYDAAVDLVDAGAAIAPRLLHRARQGGPRRGQARLAAGAALLPQHHDPDRPHRRRHDLRGVGARRPGRRRRHPGLALLAALGRST